MNVEVVVVDEQGRPACQLEVWLWSPAQSAPGMSVTSTDGEGRATLVLNAPGRYRLVAVTPGPGASRWVDQALIATWGEQSPTPRTLNVRLDAPAPPRLRLRLAEGLRLEGQIESEPGLPRDASVFAVPLRPPWGEEKGTVREVRVTADATGRFHLENLQATQWLLFATAPGQELDVRSCADTSYWRHGRPWVLSHPLVAEQGVQLTLRRRGWVTGRVLGATGLPLERFALNGHRVISADGRFMVRRRDGQGERLTLTAPGHAGRTWSTNELLGPEQLDLGDVVLETGRSVFVRTVDARTGESVAEATLTPLVPGMEDNAAGRLDFRDGAPEDWWPGLDEELERARARRREAGGTLLEHVASESELLVTAEGYVPLRAPLPADATHWEARLMARP